MNSNNMLTIKTKKGKHGEIRRASVPLPKTYDAFRAQFVEVFGPIAADARLKFEDDEGDLVTLANQSDFEEAMRVVAQSQPHILRVTVQESRCQVPVEGRDSERKPHHHHGRAFHHGSGFGGCPMRGGAVPSDNSNPLGPLGALLHTAKASLPELLSNPALRAMAEGLIQSNVLKIVQPYVCDSCNVSISGDRFNSTTNPNFDLCSTCMASPAGQKLEIEHRFKRITALESLVETLSNGGTFDAFFAEGPAREEPAVTHRCICDGCNVHPVRGIRYKCLDCADVDFCALCIEKQRVEHAGGRHVFHAIGSELTIPDEVVHAHREMRAAEEAKRAADEAAAAKAAAEARAAAAEAEQKAQEAAAKAREAERHASAFVKLEQPAQPAPSAPVAAKEEREQSAFEKSLLTLESMGFTDRKKNIQVLVRQRGRLFEAIQELLNSQ